MTLAAAMEVDTAVLLAVVVIHGGAVGISSVPYDRQHPAGLGLQKLNAGLTG
jgi:hypothetical protein